MLCAIGPFGKIYTHYSKYKQKRCVEMKKRISLLIALMLCTGMMACGAPKEEKSENNTAGNEETVVQSEKKEEQEDAAEGGRTVTDVTGRTFEVPENLERIVALTPGDCEIIYALGGGDLLVGRGEYCNYPQEAAEVVSVQSGSETNIEQIIALEPQVVIMSKMDQSEEQVAALENAGIAVCMDTETDIEGVYESIRVIGEIIGHEEQAETVVKEMQDTFTELQKKVKDEEGSTVYYEVSPLEYGLWTTGKNTFMNEIGDMLGLTNIFSDIDGWAEVSEEQVLERNPDYIVTVTMYFGDGPKPEEEIMGRAGWQNVTAVKEGNVYNANSDQISRPGPRLADAAEMLYEFVYEK